MILWPYSCGLTGHKRGASFNMTPLALTAAERRCGSQLHFASRVTPSHRTVGDYWTTVHAGPSWLPLVGNYPLLRRELARLKYHYLVWAHLGARYGSVVGLRLGRDLVVLVSGYTAIRAVLTREEFEGRPDGFFFKLRTFGQRLGTLLCPTPFFKLRTFGQRLGLVFTDGALWQEQRRFSLVHLRNLGLGKSSMEAQIQAEAEELVVSLRDKGSGNRPVVMHDAFDICVLNSLWALLAGHRFALNDKRLAELIDIVHASFRMLDMSGGLLNQMPFLRFLAPDKSGYTCIVNILERMFNFLRVRLQLVFLERMASSQSIVTGFVLYGPCFMETMAWLANALVMLSSTAEDGEIVVRISETIREHRTTLNPDFSRDLIDSFLVEMDKQPNSTFSGECQLKLPLPTTCAQPNMTSQEVVIVMLLELQLLALCLDLFMAGSETTSNTLGFATAYMLLHPDIQDRVHQELEREVGRERQPALQDRARLSYIEAVLMEVQRHGNVVPVAVAHRATRTADLMGHIIPQGATLLVSLHSLHMDPTHWGDPDTFRPERFLDAQGKLLQDDWFLPFGVVVRVPGYRFRGLIPRASRIFCGPVGLERGQAQLNNEDKQASVSRRDACTLHPVPLFHNTAPQLHLVGPSRGIPPFDQGVRRGDHLSTALLRCPHPTKTRLFGKITSDSTNLRNNKSRVVGGSVPKCDVSLVTSFKETGFMTCHL
uniref:(California timema) hypothetical protein n=1 Tax=Timema californicum TaxID=61474 RepID=A0A7R9PAB4_TIMCA|nr:unnamed protein product [Timema californicum]